MRREFEINFARRELRCDAKYFYTCEVMHNGKFVLIGGIPATDMTFKVCDIRRRIFNMLRGLCCDGS